MHFTHKVKQECWTEQSIICNQYWRIYFLLAQEHRVLVCVCFVYVKTQYKRHFQCMCMCANGRAFAYVCKRPGITEPNRRITNLTPIPYLHVFRTACVKVSAHLTETSSRFQQCVYYTRYQRRSTAHNGRCETKTKKPKQRMSIICWIIIYFAQWFANGSGIKKIVGWLFA